MKDQIKKIAVLCRGAYGDLLCVQPLIKQLLKEDHLITVIVDESNHALLKYFPLPVKILILKTGGNKYWNLLSKAISWRKHKFDEIIIAKPEPSRLHRYFAWVLGAKKRFAIVEKLNAGAINYPTLLDTHNLHSRHQSLQIFDLARIDKPKLTKEDFPVLALPLSIQGKNARFTNKIRTIRQKSQGPLLFVSLTNNRPECLLREDKLIRYLNTLYKEIPFTLIINVIQRDILKADALSKNLSIPSHCIVTQSFDELMILLNEIDGLFIGEGGILHISAALGKPSVTLAARMNKDRWYPMTDAINVQYFWHEEHVNSIESEIVESALQTLMHHIEVKNEKSVSDITNLESVKLQ